MGKIEGKEVDLARHAADHRHRLAEVRLGVAGGMDERHEHLARPKPPLTDIVLHDGVAAGEPVLVPETLEDALRRVPLLVVAGPIVFQNPIDDPRERTQLRPPWRLAAAIPRRHRERQHLAYRLAVQPEHPRGLAGAHPLNTTRPPNPRVQIHPIHPPRLPVRAILTEGYRRSHFGPPQPDRPGRFSGGLLRRRSHPLTIRDDKTLFDHSFAYPVYTHTH